VKAYQVSNKQYQSGFTIIELLIGLALAALLSAAVVRIVITNSQNIRLTDSYSKLQDSARFAMDYLAKDMRMGGYMGCINTNRASPKITYLLNTADTDYRAGLHSFTESLRAINNYGPSNTAEVTLWNSVKPAGSTMVPVQDTDVFISSSAMPTDIVLGAAHLGTTNNMSVSGPANQLSALAAGSILMLSDCSTSHIFSISGITFPTTTTATITHGTTVTNGINNTQALFTGKDYGVGSQVSLMNTTVYFIAKSNLIASTTGPSQVNSLYRMSTINGGTIEELVPYIQDMQLDYGVDTNNDGAPDIYKTAYEMSAAGNDMASTAYSVKITLTVAGEVDINPPQVGTLANDGKLRKIYTRTINIRNAGLANY